MAGIKYRKMSMKLLCDNHQIQFFKKIDNQTDKYDFERTYQRYEKYYHDDPGKIAKLN